MIHSMSVRLYEDDNQKVIFLHVCCCAENIQACHELCATIRIWDGRKAMQEMTENAQDVVEPLNGTRVKYLEKLNPVQFKK